MARYVLPACLVIVLSLAPAGATSTEIHVSADLGPLVSGGGASINPAQLMGSRFSVSQATEVTAIGGHMFVFQSPGNNGLVFGAIVALSGPSALPQGNVPSPSTLSDALSASEVVAYTTFNAGATGSDFRTPLSVTLPAGDYALVFGSGLYGAGANGILRNNNSDRPGSGYFVWTAFGSWRDDPTTTGLRFVVEGVPANADPVADAGEDQDVECTSAAGASVTLSGSATDPDGDDLTLAWAVPAGVTLDDPSSDTPTGTFPIGITMATLTVTDGNGGIAVDDVVITVEDTVPPEVACTTDVAALWPPNHQLVSIEVFVEATDACSAPGDLVLLDVSVSSNEPDDGLGDGDTAGDVAGSDGYTAPVVVTSAFTYDAAAGGFQGSIVLRAERDGSGDGRIYSIEATVLDSANNEAETSCVVVVPHDRRKSK